MRMCARAPDVISNVTAALCPTSGGSPEKFVIRAKASSPSAPVNQRSRSQVCAPHDAQAVCWRGSSFHSSPRALRSHQPTSAPVTWIIRTSPIAPSSMSRLAATGASRKRCCDTTASRTPAARHASTISAHSDGGLGHRLLDEEMLARGRRGERLRQVDRRRRGEDDGIDIVAREQRVKVGFERDAEVGRQRGRALARRSPRRATSPPPGARRPPPTSGP